MYLAQQFGDELTVSRRVCADTEQVSHLADDDEYCRSGYEATDDRAAQQLGKETEAQSTAGKQHESRQEREDGCEHDVL